MNVRATMTVASLLLMACTSKGEDSGTTEDAVDLRIQEDDISTFQDGDIVIGGPDFVVEPYTDVMMCQYGTWTYGDKGITVYQTWENTYGHHLQILGTSTSEIDAADGATFPCTTSEDLAMENLEPLALATSAYRDGVEASRYFTLPEGMAQKIDDGQRFVMQSHIVNVTDTPVRVRDMALFRTMDEAEVETWAAPLVANTQRFEVPPGQELSYSFDCNFRADYGVLALGGHMHEWGTSFTTEVVDESGASQLVYEVPTWEASFRDNAPINVYDVGAMQLPATSTLRTTCNWRNDTEEPLSFPHEMCVTYGLIYPSTAPDICDEG